MTSNPSQAFAIEVQGHPAGIVVADRGGYTFFASDWTFRDLDRRLFRHIDQAQRAAKRIYARRSRSLAQ